MLKYSDPHSSAKAVMAFFIVVIAFVVLFVFQTNKENIISTGSLQTFVFSTFVVFSLLLALLFLVNRSEESVGKTKGRGRR